MTNIEMGDRIKQLRQKRGYSLRDLEKISGLSVSSLNRWENGTSGGVKASSIQKLADALGCTPAFILGVEDDYSGYDNVEPLPRTKRVPLIGAIACGEPILATENIEKWIEAGDSLPVDFALRCKGQSMINARIFDGDVVYIRKQPTVENGEIAAVLIGDEATLKRVWFYNGRLELRAENPTFPTLNFEGADLGKVKILGKAIAFTSFVH
jgi:repressor LexA